MTAGEREFDARIESVDLAGLDIHSFPFEIAGRCWHIRAVRDQSALLAAFDRIDAFPFGLLLWESAPALAAALAERQTDLSGRRVLEIGAGTGLPGLVAAHLGADVTQIDHSAWALALARLNAKGNDIAGVRQVVGDWASWCDDAGYDLILGSDVLYDRDAHATVLSFIERSLAEGGRVLLSDPGRQDTALFEAMLANTFDVARTVRVETVIVRAGHQKSVAITVLDASRSRGA